MNQILKQENPGKKTAIKALVILLVPLPWVLIFLYILFLNIVNNSDQLSIDTGVLRELGVIVVAIAIIIAFTQAILSFAYGVKATEISKTTGQRNPLATIVKFMSVIFIPLAIVIGFFGLLMVSGPSFH